MLQARIKKKDKKKKEEKIKKRKRNKKSTHPLLALFRLNYR